MLSLDRFEEITEDELNLLPAYVHDELNGGVLIDPSVYLHPGRMADDLYILGTYSDSSVFGKQIVLYYGSFAATMGYASEEQIRLQIRSTLRHEFLHHLETRAGMFGKGTLIEEDRDAMMKYYMRHKPKEEERDEHRRDAE